MERLHATDLIRQGKQRLEGTNALRLAALHTGITVGAGLAITILQYILSEGIGSTTGLSGMGTRSILETVQMVLQWANTVLMPFWSLGFLQAALLWARGQYARKEDLLTGFHRIGPCLGLLLNRALLMISIMVICANITSAAYMVTPAAEGLTALMEQAGTDMNAVNAALDQLTGQQIHDLFLSLVPLLIVWGLVSALLLIPLLYRFRLAEYAILDHPGMRAMPAMIVSASLLRRRCWQLVKVDLRLWWYYGLKLLCSLLFYGDIFLSLMGITLPLSEDGLFFGTYLVYLAALFCVETLFRPRVETAYACAYEALKEMGPAAKKTPTAPEKLPWDEE